MDAMNFDQIHPDAAALCRNLFEVMEEHGLYIDDIHKASDTDAVDRCVMAWSAVADGASMATVLYTTLLMLATALHTLADAATQDVR